MVDLLLLFTMNKIISSYKWKLALMPFFVLELNSVRTLLRFEVHCKIQDS